MISQGINAFCGKRVLLLQGPVGPFFRNLASDLTAVGASVLKVNFNAGDALFYPTNAISFNQRMSEWPAFFDRLLDQYNIDTVLLFGDCRPIHRHAHAAATKRNVDVGVFEEGYLRPKHITFERNGVNGHSALPKSPIFYLNQIDLPDVPDQDLGNTYWPLVWWGFCYFLVGALGKPWFKQYKHHRKLSLFEAWPWLLSACRKPWYQWRERHSLAKLIEHHDGNFFIVPLQVHNDSQISEHSCFSSVEEFIERIMHSFATYAPANTALAIKHHPMDRGYTNYEQLIQQLAIKLGLTGRCWYLHDQHLPTMLDHACGVVVINSTVGLQALRHGTPVKALGDAIYNMQGLAYQGPLDKFWKAARKQQPNNDLLHNFICYLKNTNQINGSFYRKLPDSGWKSGVAWLVRKRAVTTLDNRVETGADNLSHEHHIQKRR